MLLKRVKKSFYFLILVLLLIFLLPIFSSAKKEQLNVLLITIDTLRADYLGCYGNNWIKTPNIDKLAEQSTLFENAYAEGLPTIPVRKALFTGRYTLPFSGWEPLYSDDRTLSEIFYWEGIRSILITDTLPMHMPRFGYERGFDHVEYIRG